MPTFILRLLCKLLDHKGPAGTIYSVKPVTAHTASVKWACTRCGERLQGVMLGTDKPGAVISVGRNDSDSTHAEVNPMFVLGTRMDLRYRQPILEQIAASEDALIICSSDDLELMHKLKRRADRV